MDRCIYTLFIKVPYPKLYFHFKYFLSQNPLSFTALLKQYCMMITILVNEKAMEVNQDFHILQLLKKINSPLDGIAVAVNHCIISKHLWSSTSLSANDKVLIIQATQGG
ncbi:sulfur carrier protein ThiS [Aequorivita xiaoshiensis]|uniref:Sulfur carrier protein ThiS n=1 Tax=Aequorivita xiaoshiensis TaxID=2874476 RepID=A0A9X1U5B1_9FLAO|nr:sulfur carrier protein ThiS [Aequorivita xiaoshiensis]MCG2431835.1 sulfur carrier protein ThiS [Aequorivita xiaoshiensis]